jgi:hypothetical protein|tara:strand:- start:3435 stop:4178 length:744 start_codon:yes stop_codon:yes gene_type:complete
MAKSLNIDNLKGLVSTSGGIARGNVYQVVLPPIDPLRSTDLNLLCSSVNLPGRQIMTQSRDIGLINQKVANNHAYDDISLTFLCLNDYGIRNYFENWQNLAINQETLEVGYLNEYTFDIQIKQLKKGFGAPLYSTPLGIPRLPAELQNRLPKIELGGIGTLDFAQGELDLDFITEDQVIYEVNIFESFPTSMGAIQLANSSDGVIELTVQLSYRNWSSKTTATTIQRPIALNPASIVSNLVSTVLDQ